jgi:hypothetical protein
VVKYQKYRAQQGALHTPSAPHSPSLCRREVSDQAPLHLQPPPRDVRRGGGEHLHDLPGPSLSLPLPPSAHKSRSSTPPSPTLSSCTSLASGSSSTALTALSSPPLASLTTSPRLSPSSVPLSLSLSLSLTSSPLSAPPRASVRPLPRALLRRAPPLHVRHLRQDLGRGLWP